MRTGEAEDGSWRRMGGVRAGQRAVPKRGPLAPLVVPYLYNINEVTISSILLAETTFLIIWVTT